MQNKGPLVFPLEGLKEVKPESWKSVNTDTKTLRCVQTPKYISFKEILPRFKAGLKIQRILG